MFFLIVIVLLVVFHSRTPQTTVEELWFMLSVFLALAYLAGFLDSRLFARLDKKNANLLAEAEERYEQHIDPAPLTQAND